MHRVRLQPYLFDLCCVSNRQYRLFRADHVVEAFTKERPGLRFELGEDDYPVTSVSWNDALEYCRVVGGDLPTEAQWEYAGRGPGNLSYPWENAWLNGVCSGGRPHITYLFGADQGGPPEFGEHPLICPVDFFPGGRSWCGAYDLVGNVWQWCRDWFAPYTADGCAAEDPKGPVSGEERVIRGTGWKGAVGAMVCSFRSRMVPDYRTQSVGFRCVRDLR